MRVPLYVRGPARSRIDKTEHLLITSFPKINWHDFWTGPSPYPYRSTKAVWFTLLDSHDRKSNLRKNCLDATSNSCTHPNFVVNEEERNSFSKFRRAACNKLCKLKGKP